MRVVFLILRFLSYILRVVPHFKILLRALKAILTRGLTKSGRPNASCDVGGDVVLHFAYLFASGRGWR